jgi:hypothetical protein
MGRGCVRGGRTEELLCRDEQVGNRLFDLRELLLGLHCLASQ